MSGQTSYAAFLAGKRPRPQSYGVTPGELPAGLFEHQEHCARFAIERGRAGIFLDTGLGKTAIE
ncbi:MAG TPA: hypothetical protein VN730_00660, partial [Steroidobacteraceae bacterium]|nr:hypothetical protein [Steroidobacteraceae bacterium]